MTIALSHQTALDYLRAHPCAGRNERVVLPPIPPRGACGTTAAVVKRVRSELPDADSAHLFVLDRVERYARAGIEWHQISTGIPKESFVFINHLYCVCPEFLFLQMASVLPFGSLVELGFFLCGDYDAAAAPFFDSQSNALTTPDKLQSYLSGCFRVDGLETARRAVQYVLAGSASPRESKLAILLILPPRLGGYGLPFPQMNARIGATGRIGDLVWAQQKVALEYDSLMFHGTREADERDSIRRVEADLAGYSVIAVKRPQLNDRDLFDDAVRVLKRKLGIRYRKPSQKEIARRIALRAELDL